MSLMGQILRLFFFELGLRLDKSPIYYKFISPLNPLSSSQILDKLVLRKMLNLQINFIKKLLQSVVTQYD
jgi:hypothetical protein